MQLAAIAISVLSLLVAVISLIMSAASNAKANRLQHESVRLASAMVETEIRATIAEETTHVNEVAMKLTPLLSKQKTGKMKEREEHELQALRKNWKAAVQGMLNAYEEACTKYLDRKIDRDRFKATYHVEIRNLLEAEHLKEFFDAHTSRYKAIIKVYDEWENLEK